MKRLSRMDFLIIAASVAMYVAVASFPFKAKPFGDLYFHQEAKRIAGFIKGSEGITSITLEKAPAPSLFYAVPYLFVNPSADDNDYWLMAILWTGLWMTAALVILGRIAASYFKEKPAAIIIVALCFIIPLHIYYSLGILAEGLAFMAVVLMMLGWSKFSDGSGFIAYSTGVLLLILSRPNAAVVIPLTILYCVWLIIKKKDQQLIYQRLLKSMVYTSVILGLFFGGLRLLPGNQKDTQANYFLHVAQHGRFQFREETWDWRFWDNDTRAGSKDYENWQVNSIQLGSQVKEGTNTLGKVYAGWIFRDLVSHPFTSSKQFAVRMIYGHTLIINSVQPKEFKAGPFRGVVAYYALMGGINLLNWSIILLGIFYAVRSKKLIEFLPLLVPWIALVIFHSLIYMEQRYLFPIRPVMLFLATGAILMLWKKLMIYRLSG